MTAQTAVDPNADGSGSDGHAVRVRRQRDRGINPGSLLATVIYPDGGQVHYTYYANGAKRTMTDQNGTTHTYRYDASGRTVSDAISLAAGSGIDGTVQSIGFAYDAAGSMTSVTSYGSGQAVLNQVAMEYNTSGSLTRSTQAHGGAVDAATPGVGYGYRSTMGSTSGLLSEMMYPDGRKVQYLYGRQGGDAFGPAGRLAEIADQSGQVYVSYSYIGVDTVVRADYSQVQGGLRKSYGSPAAGGYDGLDGLGRITDLRWTRGDGTLIDGYGYGYDGSGNRLWRQNLTATGLDERYTYDALSRLTGAQRGVLNEGRTAITGTPSLTQGWTLDGVGNWAGFDDNGASQTRTTNAANEITGPAVGPIARQPPSGSAASKTVSRAEDQPPPSQPRGRD